MIPAGPLAYGTIYLAAVLEGEIMFAAASVLVAAGQLDPLSVIVAGALGAATGDQLWFYGLRGGLHGWLTRFRPSGTRHRAIVGRVRRHHILMILAIRFAPGLRIAITAACAYARVSPVRFSVLNTIAAFAWAGGMLGVVTWVGPAALSYVGLNELWGAVVAAALILSFAWWLGRDLSAPSLDHEGCDRSVLSE